MFNKLRKAFLNGIIALVMLLAIGCTTYKVGKHAINHCEESTSNDNDYYKCLGVR